METRRHQYKVRGTVGRGLEKKGPSGTVEFKTGKQEGLLPTVF